MNEADIISVMRLVQGDARREVTENDGKPFDGRTVGTQFGNVAGEIVAIARAVELLAEKLNGIERTLQARTEHLV
jgi:hypothetical protein